MLECYDRQARDWAAGHGGSVVELHACAVRDRDAGEQAVARLYELYLETRQARVCAEAVLWSADCPLFAPGSFRSRPRVRTPFGGLVLASGFRLALDPAVYINEESAFDLE